MQFLRKAVRIALDALYAFGEDDGWALASHIALSAILALFPFLIFLTALAGFFGSQDIADNLATLLLDTWPQEVAGPLAREVHNVLGTTRGGVLTVSVLLAVYFASSGASHGAYLTQVAKTKGASTMRNPSASSAKAATST